jgi:hypothetical protein
VGKPTHYTVQVPGVGTAGVQGFTVGHVSGYPAAHPVGCLHDNHAVTTFDQFSCCGESCAYDNYIRIRTDMTPSSGKGWNGPPPA